MTIYERIKQRRKELNLSADDVANALGVSRATVYRYESSYIEKLPTSALEPLANVLKCTPGYLMGWTDNDDSSVPIPVLGEVAAGIPINAIQEIIDTEEISAKLASTGQFFGLQIKGNSMEPRICNGDVVIVRQQPDAESGDIVIATINGDEATCKRLRKYKDGIELIPNNPTYEPMYFSKEDIQQKPVRILGKVIELRGKF